MKGTVVGSKGSHQAEFTTRSGSKVGVVVAAVTCLIVGIGGVFVVISPEGAPPNSNTTTTATTVPDPVPLDADPVALDPDPVRLDPEPVVISSGGNYPECPDQDPVLADVVDRQTGVSYVVQAGDSLAAIAAESYGNSTSTVWQPIYDETNKLAAAGSVDEQGRNYTMIAQPDLIFIGDVLHLPAAGIIDDIRERQLSPLADSDPAAGTLSDFLRIGGSSTVYPISERIAQCYVNGGFNGTISMTSDGSLTGLERLCSDEIDLLGASVAFDREDLPANCEYEFDDLIRIQVGYDAVAVVVSAKNLHIAELLDAEAGDGAGDPSGGSVSLTRQQLQQLLSSASRWNEVAGADAAIRRYFPGSGSGTMRFTAEALLGRPDLSSAPNVIESCDGQTLDREDDDVLARCLADDPDGIGFVPYRAYRALADEIVLLPVDGRVPTAESVGVEADERYQLLRELYLYVPESKLAGLDELPPFINFYLRLANQVAVEEDFLDLDPEQLERSIADYCRSPASACEA